MNPMVAAAAAPAGTSSFWVIVLGLMVVVEVGIGVSCWVGFGVVVGVG